MQQEINNEAAIPIVVIDRATQTTAPQALAVRPGREVTIEMPATKIQLINNNDSLLSIYNGLGTVKYFTWILS